MAPDSTKLEQFLTVLFQSQLTKPELQQDIIKYVSKVELCFQDQLKTLQKQLKDATRKLAQERSKLTARQFERSDLEQLFLKSVEETKRRVAHRKLTSELNAENRRPLVNDTSILDEALHKLTELAKDKVKAEDFTANDRAGLLEIFLENEEVWRQMHLVIFKPQKG